MNKPETIKAKIKPHLIAGEKVLWLGNPAPKRMLDESLLGALFGAFFLFIGLGRAMGFLNSTDGKTNEFVVIIFIIIGILMTVNPLFEYFKARKTYYIITNFRIIIFHDTPALDIESYFKEGINTIKVKEKSNDYGDIIFREQLEDDSDGGKTKHKERLWGIKDLKKVSQLVTNLESRVGSSERTDTNI